MRSSHATWVFVAIVAAATCIQTGCGFTRLGKNVGSMSMSRPKLVGWRKEKPNTQIASTRPPSSSIPPSGNSTTGSGSRSFPSEPAPSSNYNYASTSNGGGEYAASSGAGDTYVAAGGSANGGAASGAQRGFYDPNYGNTAGSQYGDTSARGGNYDTYGGASRDYNPSYGGSAAQNYEQVADRRGDNYDSTYGGGNASPSYGNTSGGSQYGDAQSGGSQYGDGQYGASQTPASYNGGSQYNTQNASGSRFVSPSGGAGNVDDYRSPAQGSYNDTYNGGSYDNTYGAPAASGGNTSPASSTSPRWLPGSTKNSAPYDQQQQLAPPTTSWGN